MKRAMWVVMTVLATLVAVYAGVALLLPQFGAPIVAARRATMPIPLAAHLTGGLVALAIGAWQMNARLRNRVIALHRWMGRIYVVAVLVGGLGALRLAVVSEEGWITHAGFGALGALWLFTTARGYVAIRSHDEVQHRRWMIRSYSLTFAAVTLRIYLPISLAAGIPFGAAYPVISWMCWVPNLLVAEWMLRHMQAPLPLLAVRASTPADGAVV